MFENNEYWAISNQAPNRRRLNDYPFGLLAIGVRPQRHVVGENPLNGSALTLHCNEDIVCTYREL